MYKTCLPASGLLCFCVIFPRPAVLKHNASPQNPTLLKFQKGAFAAPLASPCKGPSPRWSNQRRRRRGACDSVASGGVGFITCRQYLQMVVDQRLDERHVDLLMGRTVCVDEWLDEVARVRAERQGRLSREWRLGLVNAVVWPMLHEFPHQNAAACVVARILVHILPLAVLHGPPNALKGRPRLHPTALTCQPTLGVACQLHHHGA